MHSIFATININGNTEKTTDIPFCTADLLAISVKSTVVLILTGENMI